MALGDHAIPAFEEAFANPAMDEGVASKLGYGMDLTPGEAPPSVFQHNFPQIDEPITPELIRQRFTIPESRWASILDSKDPVYDAMKQFGSGYNRGFTGTIQDAISGPGSIPPEFHGPMDNYFDMMGGWDGYQNGEDVFGPSEYFDQLNPDQQNTLDSIYSEGYHLKDAGFAKTLQDLTAKVNSYPKNEAGYQFLIPREDRYDMAASALPYLKTQSGKPYIDPIIDRLEQQSAISAGGIYHAYPPDGPVLDYIRENTKNIDPVIYQLARAASISNSTDSRLEREGTERLSKYIQDINPNIYQNMSYTRDPELVKSLIRGVIHSAAISDGKTNLY